VWDVIIPAKHLLYCLNTLDPLVTMATRGKPSVFAALNQLRVSDAFDSDSAEEREQERKEKQKQKKKSRKKKTNKYAHWSHGRLCSLSPI
jgi:Ni/Co efflux regulator RcnB